jgi:hypothetical protein
MKKNALVLLLETVKLIFTKPILFVPVALLQVITFAYAIQFALGNITSEAVNTTASALILILAWFVVIYTAILTKNIVENKSLNAGEGCSKLTGSLTNLFGIILAVAVASTLIILVGGFLSALIKPYLSPQIKAGIVAVAVLVPILYVYVYLCLLAPLVTIFEKKSIIESFRRSQDLVKDNIILAASYIILMAVLFFALNSLTSAMYAAFRGNLVAMTATAYISSTLLITIIAVMWALVYNEVSKA